MPDRISQMVVFFLCLALSGCAGTLDLWGVNVQLPGDDDDDDDGPPDIDLSDFDGTEYLNIRWDPEQADAGRVDCQEVFDVSGELLSDTDDCPSCDLVWAVDLSIADDSRPCLDQGTDLDPPDEFARLVGMAFRGNDEFDVYRTTDDSGGQLEALGEGAFDGLSFTWSGVGAWEYHFANVGFTLFYSGEGDF